MDEKILISGTGRCGTTFLIKLFSFIGMDTGYTLDNYREHMMWNCNSGMEQPIYSQNYILKSPLFLTDIPTVVRSVKIKYMILPIREYASSARSRASHGRSAGGLMCANDLDSQLLFYYKMMAEYLFYMTKYDIPTIFLDFDRMVNDQSYLYTKLKVILDEAGLDKDAFVRAYDIATTTSKPV